jgi:hypothetical protein
LGDQKIYWDGDEYVLNFEADERDILHSIASQMRSMIAENDPDTYRLFPPAYMDDLAKQEEYRMYMSDELMKAHMSALDVLEEVSLSNTVHEDDLYAVVRAINHIRLVLGTRLDIDEESDVSDISPDDPDIGLYNLYFWLGWLLEDAITALARTIPDTPATED